MKDGLCLKLQGGTWEDVLGNKLSALEKMQLRNAPQSALLNAIQLCMGVGYHRCRSLLNCLPENILPEINLDAKRRCMYIQDDKRCKNYSAGGACMTHATKVVAISKHFKSKTIRDAHDAFRKDPRRLSLDPELATLRVLLTQTINLCTNPTNGQIGLQGIQTATVLVDKTRAMVESISSISKLTPEYVDNLLNKVIEAATEYIEPNKLEEFAKRVEALMIMEPEPDVPIEEGTVMEINGEEHVVEVEAPTQESIQVRALLKYAQDNNTISKEELDELKKKHGITDLNS